MKPLHPTFSAGAKAKLILVKNQPMLSITEANGKVITIHPKQSALLYFGLEKEHTEMLEWLDFENLIERIQIIESGQMQEIKNTEAIVEEPFSRKMKI